MHALCRFAFAFYPTRSKSPRMGQTERFQMLKDPLFILAALACVVVAVVLIKGISTFGKEGIENAKRANKFMQYRIIAQFVAVLLILLFVYVRRQSGGE